MLEPDSLDEFLAVLRRRKGRVVLTAAVVFIAAALTAVLWPPTFRSTATILMEEPAIPRDLIRSTIARERVQVITQRVMATRNLLGIMDKHKLYTDERVKVPVGIIVKNMRKNIKFALISAEVTDPNSGRSIQANIAFTLSFDYRHPQIAQRVLSEIVSLYLAENVRARQAKVSETAEFLSKEAEKLEKKVNELEAKLAVFKQKNAGSLPEDVGVTRQRMDRFEGAFRETKGKILILEERKIFLESELAQIDSQMSFGQGIRLPEDRLRQLQSIFISLNARYGPEHPDVVRAKREIDALEREVGPVDGSSVLTEGLKLARSELAVLREKYGEEHPDVVKSRRKVTRLKGALKKSQKKSRDGSSRPTKAAVNPAYIQVRAQLKSIDLELNSLRSQRAELKKQIEGFEDIMMRSPEVERSYKFLVRDYRNVSGEYQRIRTKLTEAELGRSLEAASKSERLTLIEPPLLPVDPISPNRKAILALGFVLSLASSIGLVVILEAMSPKVYGERILAEITGSLPLAVIPDIMSVSDLRRRRGKWALSVVSSLAILVGLTTAFHIYFTPLDVLWFKIERRMG